MPEYDAIVIGAGHNGLTAGAVMARDGLRVLVVEKNQYVGGMAATTELIRGYRYETRARCCSRCPTRSSTRSTSEPARRSSPRSCRSTSGSRGHRRCSSTPTPNSS